MLGRIVDGLLDAATAHDDSIEELFVHFRRLCRCQQTTDSEQEGHGQVFHCFQDN